MRTLLMEREIHRMYDGKVIAQANQYCGYNLCAEVWIKFLPYDGEGLSFDALVDDKDKQEQFLPAIKRGLAACMDYYSLHGVRAIWLDCFLGSNTACDIALSWAAALALRDALSADSVDADSESEDDEWLKKAGLYTQDDTLLASYGRERICKEHPWVSALYELDNTASRSTRLDIIRQAVDSGDDFAKTLLSTEIGDSHEQFLSMKERALEENDIGLLTAVCENYDLGNAADPTDPDVIECYIRLGEAYKEQGIPAKMSAAYEKAWEHADRLKVADQHFMLAFAERIGDLFNDQAKPFYDMTLATLWHNRAKKGNWNSRVESAIQSRNIAECLYLGTCCAEGRDTAVQKDEREAEKLYLTAKWLWQAMHPNMISDYYRIPAQNEKKAEAILIVAATNLAVVSHVDYDFQESIKANDTPATKESTLELMAKIDEKLGDLYAKEGGELYDYQEAFNCYMAAAKNNNSSAKEKTLKLMKNKK
jgi:hypothetical protein